MNNQELSTRLNAIVNAIMEVEEYTRHMDYQQFRQAEETKRIVAQNLQVVGNEATMSKDYAKEMFADFDFEVLQRLSDMRPNLELEMNLQPLFHIIKEDLPEIRSKINDMLRKLPQEEMMY